MDATALATVSLIHAWIRGIHPMLWRRFLVRSDRTLADRHWILPIGFGWTDVHLHRFRIRQTSDAIPQMGVVEGHDARHVTVMDLQCRINERFLYEYDGGDRWQHEIRIEKHSVIDNGVPVQDGGTSGGVTSHLRLFPSRLIRTVSGAAGNATS